MGTLMKIYLINRYFDDHQTRDHGTIDVCLSEEQARERVQQAVMQIDPHAVFKGSGGDADQLRIAMGAGLNRGAKYWYLTLDGLLAMRETWDYVHAEPMEINEPGSEEAAEQSTKPEGDCSDCTREARIFRTQQDLKFALDVLTVVRSALQVGVENEMPVSEMASTLTQAAELVSKGAYKLDALRGFRPKRD